MTDRIEAALAALDKMLNLPFEVFENNEIRDSTGTAIAEVWIRKKYDAHDVAELFARSPDLAAEVIRLRKWQSEALPELKKAQTREYVQYVKYRVSTTMAGEHERTYNELTRLIAEAEGGRE